MIKTLIFQLLLIPIILSFSALHECSQIKFRIVDKQLPVVSVTINGQGTFDFLLDTGTSHTIVTPKLARKLSIRPTFHYNLLTQAGSRIIEGGHLDSISIGANTATKLDVLITDLRVLEALDKNLVGVLGGNFLAGFDYLIDFDKKELTFDENGDLAERILGSQFPLEIDDQNRLFVTIPTKSRAVRFALDSGATRLTLFGDCSLAFGHDRNLVSTAASWTINGRYAVRFVRLTSIRIGNDVFNDLPAVLAAFDATRSEDGLMPLGLFRKVYLNHSKGFVVFNPAY